MIFFDKEYDWRDASVSKIYMFMTMYSVAISSMMRETKLSEGDCQLLLHVRSFKYFTHLGVKDSSFFKDYKSKTLRLIREGYIRTLLKATDRTQGVYCISNKGDEVCNKFYEDLLR